MLSVSSLGSHLPSHQLTLGQLVFHLSLTLKLTHEPLVLKPKPGVSAGYVTLSSAVSASVLAFASPFPFSSSTSSPLLSPPFVEARLICPQAREEQEASAA